MPKFTVYLPTNTPFYNGFQNSKTINSQGNIYSDYKINDKRPSWYQEALRNYEWNSWKLLDKIENGKDAATTIAYGEVQSGKTENILSTMFMAMDNGYDLVLWIAANTLMLLEQSIQRFRDAYREFSNENRENVLFITTYANQEMEIINQLKKPQNRNKKIIIAVLKQSKDYLSTIKKSLKADTKKFNKILIIDDECDYGADKTNKYQTQINEDIRDIITIGKLKAHHISYLLFSATPFVNMDQGLKKNIENVYVLKKDQTQYNGLRIFHGSKKEAKQIKSFRIDDLEYLQRETESDELQTVLQKIIFDHVSRVANYRLHKNNSENFQLLFNNSHQKKIHEIQFKAIRKVLAASEMISDYKKFLSRKSKFSEEHFEAGRRVLISILNDPEAIFIINDNHKEDSRLLQSSAKCQIIIAGNLASRGITFDRLLTCVMLNSSEKTNIAALLQRARWFGYRNLFWPWMRVYLTYNDIYNYQKICKIDSDIRNLFPEKDTTFTKPKEIKIKNWIEEYYD